MQKKNNTHHSTRKTKGKLGSWKCPNSLVRSCVVVVRAIVLLVRVGGPPVWQRWRSRWWCHGRWHRRNLHEGARLRHAPLERRRHLRRGIKSMPSREVWRRQHCWHHSRRRSVHHATAMWWHHVRHGTAHSSHRELAVELLDRGVGPRGDVLDHRRARRHGLWVPADGDFRGIRALVNLNACTG